MTEEGKVIEFLRGLAKEIVNWNPQTEWAKGYQEAMRHVLEKLGEK